MKIIEVLDRYTERAITTPIMWAFFFAMNIFLVSYIVYEEYFDLHPFDPYPFILLNLILAVFLAEMEIMVIIAQIVGANKTDRIIEAIKEMVLRGEDRDILLTHMMENSLAMMKTLEEMGAAEATRDVTLHGMVKAGEERGEAIESIIRSLVCVQRECAEASTAASTAPAAS